MVQGPQIHGKPPHTPLSSLPSLAHPTTQRSQSSPQNLIRTSLQKPSPTPEAKIRHARTAYFTRVLNFPLSPASYAAFLAANPSHTAPDAALLAIAQGVPEWQVAAPKAELFVDRAAREEGDGPRYPGRFAELIRFIKEGTPISGVREIPDTILRDPVSFGLSVGGKSDGYGRVAYGRVVCEAGWVETGAEEAVGEGRGGDPGGCRGGCWAYAGPGVPASRVGCVRGGRQSR